MLCFYYNQLLLRYQYKYLDKHLYKLAIEELNTQILDKQVKGLNKSKIAKLIDKEDNHNNKVSVQFNEFLISNYNKPQTSNLESKA